MKLPKQLSPQEVLQMFLFKRILERLASSKYHSNSMRCRTVLSRRSVSFYRTQLLDICQVV